MDITKDNFEVSLALVEETITKWADFCAVDLELSGVETCASKNHYLDTINERYRRIVANAPDFIIIQFGLCAFKHDPISNSYLARPFNFALFPHPFQSIDKRFVCQASSLQFLAKNNFDFNKFVYKGIPHMSKFQEDLVRKRGPHIPSKQKAALPLRDTDITFLSAIWEVLENWIHEGRTETSISLPISSAFQRRLVYQELPKRYPNFVMETIDVGGGKHMRKNGSKERLDQDLQQNIGFRKVFDMLVNSKKQIVGHNMLLDLILMYQHFQGPLPETSDLFKAKINQLFPSIIDTKLVAIKSPRFQTSNLEELYTHICKTPFDMPFIGLDAGFRSYLSGNRFHEAGFDAFVAGSVYLKLILNVTTRISNLIPIPRSDSLLNLEGLDVVPDRSKVFQVNGLPDFPRQVQEDRLVKHFSQSITWIDEVSAFVSIEPPNSYLDARIKEEICADRQYRVTPYEASNGVNVERRGAGMSVSMHESRITLDDLQEINVSSSYDVTDELTSDYKERFDTTGLRLCTLL